MVDYSDIVFLIGAMVIFSFLSRNAANRFFQSDVGYFQTDVEYEAVALAQSIVDEVKWTSSAQELSTLASSYDGTTYTVSVKNGDYEIDYDVTMTVSNVSISGSIVTNKEVIVKITSEYLPDNAYVEMQYVKSFA